MLEVSPWERCEIFWRVQMKIPKHDRLWCKNLLKTGIFLGLLWTPLRPLNEQHMPLRTILLIPLFEHVGTRECSFLTVFSHCWYDYFFTSIQRTSPLLHMALSNFPCSKKPGCFYSKNMDSIEHVFSPKKTLHPFIPNIHKQKKKQAMPTSNIRSRKKSDLKSAAVHKVDVLLGHWYPTFQRWHLGFVGGGKLPHLP